MEPKGTNALASLLFDGENVATDFKTMQGTNVNATHDEVANEIIASLNRLGLVVDGKLIDMNDSSN